MMCTSVLSWARVVAGVTEAPAAERAKQGLDEARDRS